MPKQIVLTEQGAFVVDAPSQDEARELAAKGQAKPLTMQSPEMGKLSEAQRFMIESHIQKTSKSIVPGEMARRDPRDPASKLVSGLLKFAAEGTPSEIGAQIGRVTARATKRVPEKIGEAMGSVGGELFRQLFMPKKGEKLSLTQLAGAAVVGSRARGPVRAIPGIKSRTTTPGRLARIRAVKGFVPGGGVALLEQGREEITQIPDNLRRLADKAIEQQFPGQTAGTLRQRSLQMNPEISAAGFRRQAQQFAREEDVASKFGVDFGGQLSEAATVAKTLDTVTLEDFNVVRSRLGGMMEEARDNSAKQDAISDLLSGMFRDMDSAVRSGVTGAVEYRASLEAFRRHMAALQLEGAMVGKIRSVRGEDFQSFGINQLLDQVERAFTAPNRASRPSGLRLLPDVVSPQEKDEILGLIRFWSENTTALPTRMGVNAPNVGSGQILFRGGIGALGAIATNQLAGTAIDPTAVGLVTGTLAALVGNMMMSPRGRSILREFIARGAPINVTEMVIMSTLQGGRVSIIGDIQRQISEQAAGPTIQQAPAP